MKKILFYILLSLLLPLQFLAQSSTLHMAYSERLGTPAPNYDMRDMNGRQLSSKSLRGKIVVLNFWFTACRPCIDEVPKLNKIYQKYKSNKNIVFAAVTFDSESRINAFQAKYKLKYPIVAKQKEVCDRFQNKGYPTNIIIDKAGNYYYYNAGGFDQIDEHLDEALSNVLAGKPHVTKQERPSMASSSTTETFHLKESDVFKLENGKEVDLDKAFDMVASQKYILEPQKDRSGNAFYLVMANDGATTWISSTSSSASKANSAAKSSSSRSKSSKKKKKRKKKKRRR